jgi:hypothetical protein
MSSNKSKERLVCEDYCRQFPDMKVLTLARKISAENKKQYPKLSDPEKVRKNYLLNILGLNGDALRDRIKDKDLYRDKNYDTTNSKPEAIHTGAKILILDIETMPAKSFIWDVWKQNIQPNQIISDWFIVTWAAKWLFEDVVYSGALKPKEVRKQNDKRIMQSLWSLLNEADIIIAHNAVKFDIPRINTRFLVHKIAPPSPFIIIDTLKHYQRNFAFLHNKLDYLNMRLGLGRKEETGGFELWASCYDGNQEALDKMLHYNIGDVRILESNYLILRPWIRPHPNISTFILDEHEHRCPTCGSNKLRDEGKNYHTTANVYGLLKCDNCGASSRKRLGSVTIKQKRHLLISSAK